MPLPVNRELAKNHSKKTLEQVFTEHSRTLPNTCEHFFDLKQWSKFYIRNSCNKNSQKSLQNSLNDDIINLSSKL